MSMATCKCGKVFDSDFQMSYDEKGNCCCDDCDELIYEVFLNDLKNAGCPDNHADDLADKLMNMGYRKVR